MKPQRTLIHGDCLEAMGSIEGGSVAMVFADPPYGTTANDWDSCIDLPTLWRELRRVCREDAAIVLTSAEPFTSVLITSNLADFKYRWTWNKINRVGGFLNAKRQPLRAVEDVCVFYRRQPTYNPMMTTGLAYRAKRGNSSTNYGAQRSTVTVCDGTQYPRDLINIPADERGTEGRIHPTQKPVALASYMIETYTWRRETVLDFCMGSGTAGVACQRTRRDFIGIERDREYFVAARRRIERASVEASE